MPEKRDDFNDPHMTDLLRRWGRTVRTPSVGEAGTATDADRLFGPGDLSGLHRALDEVDRAEPEVRRPDAGRLLRSPWLRTGLAVAAALVLAASLWWLTVGRPSGPDGGSPPLALRDLRLSPLATVLRGEPDSMTLRSGESAFIHFTLDRPGWVAVAVLEGAGEFSLIGGSVRSFPAGSSVHGAFVMDENPGVESFVLLASPVPRTEDDFLEIVRSVTDAVGGSGDASGDRHRETLAAIIEALELVPDLTVGARTFEHRPREP